METQQIIIYSILGLLLVMGIVILVLAILIYKNTKTVKTQSCQPTRISSATEVEAGIVFCKNCGNQYSSTEAICPNCKTSR